MQDVTTQNNKTTRHPGGQECQAFPPVKAQP